MRKGVIVAVATFAMGLMGLFASPAEGLQYGFNLGYSSVGFQLNGISGEFVLGLQEKDEHRPQGSVLRIGLGGAWGKGSTDLTKATWDGESLVAFKAQLATFRTGVEAATLATDLADARAEVVAAQDLPIPYDQLSLGQKSVVDRGVARNLHPGGAEAFDSLSVAEKANAQNKNIENLKLKQEKNATLEQALSEGYGIDDLTKARGGVAAIFLTLAYEYVLAEGAPGLGFIAGGEIYISRGGYKGNTTVYPDVKTEGGIGGGGIIGVSYYMKNGLNFTVKTGIGAVNPGKVDYNFFGTSVTVEPKTVFYASPTFSLGYLY